MAVWILESKNVADLPKNTSMASVVTTAIRVISFDSPIPITVYVPGKISTSLCGWFLSSGFIEYWFPSGIKAKERLSVRLLAFEHGNYASGLGNCFFMEYSNC